MNLEGESIMEAIECNFDVLEHIHFSVPHLQSLNTKGHQIKFKDILRFLKKLEYAYLINIEMLNQSSNEIDRCLYELTRPHSVAVIGAGWYGCHAACKLIQRGIYPSIFEQRHIFAGASKYNQNRLHLGFHYPRSFITRRLCRDNYDRFVHEYGNSVRAIDDNLYIIARKSILDFETYCQIMTASNLSFRILERENDDIDMQNVQGVIACDEKFLDPIIMRHYFEAILQRFVINESLTKETLQKNLVEKYDIVLDCTNNQLGLIKNYEQNDIFFETTLSLVYKRLYEGPIVAYTVMDGALPSLFPFDLQQNLYSLTHAQYTPLQKTKDPGEIKSYVPSAETILRHREAMEADIRLYVSNFGREIQI